MVTRSSLGYADELYAGGIYNAAYNSPLGRKGILANIPYFHAFGAVAAADPDGIVESVDPASGATLTLRATVTGMTNTGGVITLDTPRNMTITAAGNESAKSITFTGTDIYGQAMTENITGPNATTVQGKKSFKTLSSAVVTGDMSTITVGFGNVFGLPFRVPQRSRVLPVVDGKVGAITTLTSTITALGTAQDTAVITGTGGVITKIVGVSPVAGDTASAVVTVTNGTPTVATVTFASNYVALAAQASSAIAANITRDIGANGVLKIATDGGGGMAGQGVIEVTIAPALVTIADDTTATTTTGDVRGTLNFGGIPDGTVTCGAWIMPLRAAGDNAFGITQA